MNQNVSLGAYIYSLRLYILFVSILFICSIVLGYMGLLGEIFGGPVEWIRQLSMDLKESTQQYPSWMVFLVFFIVIFLNNAFSCFLVIILAPLMGIFPLFSTIINGGILGLFAREEGLIVFLAIVPHGIFEIPALLISAAIGLRIWREILKTKGERDVKKEFRDGLSVFLTLILPLLIIAALIESVLIVITLS